MLWIESIGIIAGILGIVAWVPQIYRIWIEKRADAISMPTFTVIAFALVLWLIYGILLNTPIEVVLSKNKKILFIFST